MGRNAGRRVARRRPAHHTWGRASDRRRQSRGRETGGRPTGSVHRSSGGWASHHGGARGRASHRAPSAHAWSSGSRVSGTAALASLLRRPGLGLRLELMERLFGGVGHNRLLAVKLLLGEVVHHLPHARLAAHADHTEAFALPIGSVFIELNFEEVRDPEVLDIILDVLVCCPPCQVSNVQLPLPSVLAPA